MIYIRHSASVIVGQVLHRYMVQDTGRGKEKNLSFVDIRLYILPYFLLLLFKSAPGNLFKFLEKRPNYVIDCNANTASRFVFANSL